jgi:2'-5' RNA ligase
MAKQRPNSPRLRLFVALDLPEPVKAGIAAWGGRALADPALRPVAERSLHVTLAFLGWTVEKRVPLLAEIVESCAAPAPWIALGDPVQRPERGHPRLFALPVDSLATIAQQGVLREKLLAARLYEPEKRPFWPHVTVARARREERGSKRPAPVSKLPGALPKELLRPFGGVRLTLYRSELQPPGAQYTPLAQVELPADGRQ